MLLDGNRSVKLIDFGFSICVPPENKLKIFCGTPSYMVILFFIVFSLLKLYLK